MSLVRVSMQTSTDIRIPAFQQERWSPRGRPWPRGHILKSLALNPTSPRKYSVLGSRAALFFDWMKRIKSSNITFFQILA